MKARKKLVLYIVLFFVAGNINAQQAVKPIDRDSYALGMNLGVAALESLMSEPALQWFIFYRKNLNRYFSLGLQQGFLLRDNFPSNYYSPNTTPFHLAPEVDSYIRSLTLSEGLQFEWTKTTIFYFDFTASAETVVWRNLKLGLQAGFGLRYRNYTRFGLARFTTDASGKIVDYQEKITLISVVAPDAQFVVFGSWPVAKSTKVSLSAGYQMELLNSNSPKAVGYANFASLTVGISKVFQ